MIDTKLLFNEIKGGEITPKEAVKRAETQMGARQYKEKTQEERVKQYLEARALRKSILANPVPFITPKFLPGFYLTQGLILVGGKPGKSKTTTGANVIAGFLRHVKRRKVTVITNEEAADSLYDRVACILLAKSYQQYYNGQLDPNDVYSIEDKVREITERMEVVTTGDYWDPTYIEDVQAVMESVTTNDNGLVLIDYLQTINQSRGSAVKESYQISKELGFYLKNYGRANAVPVVVLAQLSDTDGADFAGRVQNDKTIFNHAFIALEVQPDFDTLTTTFIVQKDRFCGMTGKKVVMQFKGGSLELGDEI